MARRPVVMLAAVLLSTLAAFAADTKFTSIFKNPHATGISFAGKKVVALVISKDESLRVSGEEGLARELAPRGVQPVAAYRMIPREELTDPEKAKGWFERAGAEGVVALRVVSAGKERTYVPGMWTAPYYSSFWNYYGHGWGSAFDPGYVKEDMVVVIEVLVFSVPRNELLWAGTSETTNPKNTATLLKDLVTGVVEEMRKQGMIAR